MHYSPFPHDNYGLCRRSDRVGSVTPTPCDLVKCVPVSVTLPPVSAVTAGVDPAAGAGQLCQAVDGFRVISGRPLQQRQ